MKILFCLLLVPLLLHGQEKRPLGPRSRALSTKELTGMAEVVALGTVSGMKSEWNADRTRIFTRVRIDVREFLKGGTAGQPLVLLTAGGEVGDVGEIYSGVAHFRHGEEVVVFAKGKPGGDREVVGGAQGRVPVETDAVTGEKTVRGGVQIDEFRSDVKSAAQAARPGEKK